MREGSPAVSGQWMGGHGAPIHSSGMIVCITAIWVR
jgi:hypothetical protein